MAKVSNSKVRMTGPKRPMTKAGKKATMPSGGAKRPGTKAGSSARP